MCVCVCVCVCVCAHWCAVLLDLVDEGVPLSGWLLRPVLGAYALEGDAAGALRVMRLGACLYVYVCVCLCVCVCVCARAHVCGCGRVRTAVP